LQADITRLIEQVDNIAFQTSYNGIKLLAGSFTNKEFQVGAYSHETIRASIGATSSDKIGSVRKETSAVLTAAGTSTLTFKNPSGGQDIQLESVVISTGARTGIGKLAEVINKNSDELGVRASAKVQTTGSTSITAGDIGKLYINGTEIGDVDSVEDNDRSGVLVSAINKFTADTGVLASVDTEGRLNLSSVDGRGIRISAGGVASAVMNIGSVSASADENYGRLMLTLL
jgi:flagellin